MFRAECSADTDLGRRACAVISNGAFVSDDVVNSLVAERTARPDCRHGYLLDGYPRTVPQADFFINLLRQRTLDPPVVIHLHVPRAILIPRLAARRQCPVCMRIYNLLSQPPLAEGKCDADGAALIRRDDDRVDVIRDRLKTYEERTRPVIKYFCRSGLYRIDGSPPAQIVSRQIEVALSREPATV